MLNARYTVWVVCAWGYAYNARKPWPWMCAAVDAVWGRRGLSGMTPGWAALPFQARALKRKRSPVLDSLSDGSGHPVRA